MFKVEKSIHRFLLNREIISFFSEKQFEKVLELCAGNSPCDKFINFKNKVSTDIKPLNNDIQYLDITKDFQFDDRFDLIICFEGFQYVKDWEKIISNSFKNLNKNGKLVFSCPSFTNNHEHEIVRYSREGIIGLASNSEFKKHDIIPFGNIFTIYIDYIIRKYKMRPLRILQYIAIYFIRLFRIKFNTSYSSGYFIILYK
ncbi:class I SAM-dependent methyltransferase [Flavobacteriaceae bacterium]|nr:class I SAM-dependent methyltransferase [Flavobacteriaceae bacterium]